MFIVQDTWQDNSIRKAKNSIHGSWKRSTMIFENTMVVYFSEIPSRGGGGELRIQMRKVRDLIKQCINFDHIFTKIMQFFAKFPLKYAFFSYFLFTIFDFCNFSSFFANFSHFFWKYPNFGLKFSGSFRISKTTHKTGPWKDKDFSKKYTPMLLWPKICQSFTVPPACCAHLCPLRSKSEDPTIDNFVWAIVLGFVCDGNIALQAQLAPTSRADREKNMNFTRNQAVMDMDN